MESEFAKDYDLSNVDWDFIDQQSQLNCLEVICDLWKKGIYDKHVLCELSGLSSSVVTKYLNKGDHYNIIEYDKKKTKAIGNVRAQEKMYQLNANPMTCNENGLYFGSLQLCKNTMQDITGLQFSHGNIRGTITGRYSHHHHFTFSYITREEFNNYKTIGCQCYGDFFISPNQQI